MPAFLRPRALPLLAASVLTVLLTWPLVVRSTTAGRLDSGDARHGIWNVAWVAHALSTDPAGLWDANVFHPASNALAFSEPNLLAGLMALPVWVATDNAVAAMNWVIAWSFILSALATWALVLRLTDSRAGAAFSAIAFAFAPHVFSHLAHVQLLLTFGLPLTLLALHAYVDRPGWRRGVLLGGAMAVQALGCGYYGIFAGLIVGWGTVWFASTRLRWRAGGWWAGLGLAFVTAAAIVGPFLMPYTGVREAGFARTLDDARLFSADWRAYLASPMLAHGWLLTWLGSWREVLFPGFLPLLLAGGSVALLRRGSPGQTSVSRDVVGFYIGVGVLAAWASFGPDAGLYRALFETMPFFSLLRAPSRFGLLVTLAVAVLAGIALAGLSARLDRRSRGLVIGSVFAATIAGSTVGPLALIDREPAHVVYQRLAQLPAGAVAEFPFFADRSELHRHTEYMIESTRHWKPLVNGYSDHIPEAFMEALPALARFPAADAWSALRARGARYVVVHWNKYGAGAAPFDAVQRAAREGALRPIVERDDASLFEIVRWPE